MRVQPLFWLSQPPMYPKRSDQLIQTDPKLLSLAIEQGEVTLTWQSFGSVPTSYPPHGRPPNKVSH